MSSGLSPTANQRLRTDWGQPIVMILRTCDNSLAVRWYLSLPIPVIVSVTIFSPHSIISSLKSVIIFKLNCLVILDFFAMNQDGEMNDEFKKIPYKYLVIYSLIPFLWPLFTPKRCNFPQITLINVTVRQLYLDLDDLDFVLQSCHPSLLSYRDEYSTFLPFRIYNSPTQGASQWGYWRFILILRSWSLSIQPLHWGWDNRLSEWSKWSISCPQWIPSCTFWPYHYLTCWSWSSTFYKYFRM